MGLQSTLRQATNKRLEIALLLFDQGFQDSFKKPNPQTADPVAKKVVC